MVQQILGPQPSGPRPLKPGTTAEPGRAAVLVVDDVEANLRAMRAVLGDLDCELVLAQSGNAALRELLRQEFAVILLDVQMPEMDGYEVARHVSQNPNTRDVPIVFLTATHDTKDVLRGYGSGAVDFLFKPIDRTIVRSKVRVFIDLYRSRRQIADSRRELERVNAELSAVATAKAALADQFRDANFELDRAYQDLKVTQSQLVQSAKMASLGELVAGVAHEINNPLAFVQSHLGTVRRALGEIEAGLVPRLSETEARHWDKARQRLSEMHLGIERIAELVIKLRTFSRLDEGEAKQVSVRESIESVLTISRHRCGERIKVETVYGEPDVIECYSGLLNQALLNLVSNSIDAISGEGTITITTGAVGNRYAIKVSDTGSGIPPELRARVCEPFFTTKPPGQGTGLGLSITYSIVQKHQGTLTIDDRPSGGTEITISIPMAVTEGTERKQL
jgi:two-component system, NtrC family, sensor kinase